MQRAHAVYSLSSLSLGNPLHLLLGLGLGRPGHGSYGGKIQNGIFFFKVTLNVTFHFINWFQLVTSFEQWPISQSQTNYDNSIFIHILAV